MTLVKEFLKRKEEQLAEFIGDGDLGDTKTFLLISPLDYRYVRKKSNQREGVLKRIAPVLSEKAFWEKYVGVMEVALQETLVDMRMSNIEIAREIMEACLKAEVSDAYIGEDISSHDVMGYIDNAVAINVASDKAKNLLHFTSTSYDKLSNAYVLMTKEFNDRLMIPKTLELEKVLINLTLKYADTPQVGRTHLQHAEMITFGFAIAEYVDRLGHQIERLKESAANLKGKYSGAVGAYNSSSLFFDDPRDFEKRILEKVDLEPSGFSTQIVHPEFVLNYLHHIITSFGVLANFANDMRKLQRTEVNEVCEPYDVKSQKGSSGMPHKRNPINWENIISFWKNYMPRIFTFYMDQISDHQRDLTNSASIRFLREIYAGFYLSTSRATRVTPKIMVDEESLKRNINMSKGVFISGPLRYMLSYAGLPDAYDIVKKLSVESYQKNQEGENTTILDLAKKNERLNEIISHLTLNQKFALECPEKYINHIVEHTKRECLNWKNHFKL